MDWVSEIAWGFDGFMKSGPSIALALPYIFIASLPVIFVHEYGHALVARRLLGGDVDMNVGSGGRLAEVQLGQIKTTINAWSSLGGISGQATFDASRARARDVIWIALAGPLASLVGLILLVPVYSAVGPSGVVHDFLWAALLCSAFGVLNLIPFTFQDRRDSPKQRSDGALIVDALKVVAQLR